MRLHLRRRHVTIPPMTDDLHAQANAEQVRVLREALAGQLPPEETHEPSGPTSNRTGNRATKSPVRACPAKKKSL